MPRRNNKKSKLLKILGKNDYVYYSILILFVID
jgi:hypothetical protein